MSTTPIPITLTQKSKGQSCRCARHYCQKPTTTQKESDGKVSLTLATATIDKEAERSTKTTVQLSNIDAGAGGISLTANDKHSNDKHADTT
ncbi:hypothetical protein BSPWISOXPB_3512 [uncultured Gammaproteobacteria bacterium]|nr:hypothetical protein BSPWISOXPB_3512 [uncultured Gammaproteobacteria bacterium]